MNCALPEAAEDLGVRLRHAAGRVAQPVARGILADREQDLADGALDARVVDAGPVPGPLHGARAASAADPVLGKAVIGGGDPVGDHGVVHRNLLEGIARGPSTDSSCR